MKTYKTPSFTTIPNALSCIQSSMIKMHLIVVETVHPSWLATTPAYEADE